MKFILVEETHTESKHSLEDVINNALKDEMRRLGIDPIKIGWWQDTCILHAKDRVQRREWLKILENAGYSCKADAHSNYIIYVR